MKNKRLYFMTVAVVLCVLSIGMTCFAMDKGEVLRSHREELLVSYKEYWYVDGAGIESHVKYDQQYKVYTFLNGYRELSPVITQLPLSGGMLPPNVKSHQQVQLRYEFY